MNAFSNIHKHIFIDKEVISLSFLARPYIDKIYYIRNSMMDANSCSA